MVNKTSVYIFRRWFNEDSEVKTKGIGFEGKNIPELNLLKPVFAFHFSFT